LLYFHKSAEENSDGAVDEENIGGSGDEEPAKNAINVKFKFNS
jgi:hypothetical protein